MLSLLYDSIEKLKGNKGIFWWPLCFLLLSPIAVLVINFDSYAVLLNLIPNLSKNFLINGLCVLLAMVSGLITAILSIYFSSGAFSISLQISKQLSIDENSGFRTKPYLKKLILTVLIEVVILSLLNIPPTLIMLMLLLGVKTIIGKGIIYVAATILAVTALVLFNIIISTSFLYTFPLVLDKNMAPIKAIKRSITLFRNNILISLKANVVARIAIMLPFVVLFIFLKGGLYLHVPTLLFVTMLIIVTALSLIVLTWSFPLYFMLITTLYRKLSSNEPSEEYYVS